MIETIKSKSHTIEEYFLPIVLFGYVIASALSVPLGIESRFISVPFRILVFLFSALIIYRNYNSRIALFSVFTFVFFIVFYSVKACFSFQNDIYLPFTQKDRDEFFYRILIIDFLPVIALFLVDYTKINWTRVIKISWKILFFALLVNAIYCIWQSDYNKTSGIFSVYYISSGHFGLSLVLIAMVLLMFNKYEFIGIKKEYLKYSLLLGGFAIIVSAARSPLLTLVLISLYLVFLKKEIKYFLFLLGFVAFVVVSVFYFKQITTSNFAFINRNFDFIFKGNSYGREYFLEKGLVVFKQSPIIGGRVLFEDFLYPHNVFVELLMSGGIILLGLFLLIYWPLVKYAKWFLRYNDSKFYLTLLFCFFLQYLFLAQTSYNFISNPEFWYFSALIIGVSLNLKNEKA